MNKECGALYNGQDISSIVDCYDLLNEADLYRELEKTTLSNHSFRVHNANKVELVGEVCSDVTKIYTKSNGVPILNLSYFYLRTEIDYFDASNGLTQRRVENHKVVSFGRSASYVADKIKDGMFVSVDGEVKTNRWTNSDGNFRVNRDIRLGSMSIFFDVNRPHINKVTLVGEVISDPTLIKRDESFISLLLRTSIPVKRQQADENGLNFKNEIHKIVAYSEISDFIRSNIKKGDTIFIEGEIISSYWNEREKGERRKSQEIRASIASRVV